MPWGAVRPGGQGSILPVDVAARLQRLHTLHFLDTVHCTLSNNAVFSKDFSFCTVFADSSPSSVVFRFYYTAFTQHFRRKCNFFYLLSVLHIKTEKNKVKHNRSCLLTKWNNSKSFNWESKAASASSRSAEEVQNSTNCRFISDVCLARVLIHTQTHIYTVYMYILIESTHADS